MKALSWKSPYGELMLLGKIETRSWATNYRGPVLICLTKRPCDLGDINAYSGYDLSYKIVDEHMDLIKSYYDLQGHAIAVGTLIDCRPMAKADEDKAFVLYKPELYSHIYTDVRPIVPFPFKGNQRWTNLPDELTKTIQYR